MKKFVAILLAAMLMLGLLTACGEAETEAESGKEKIIVGMAISADGTFETRDQQGNPYGVSVALLDAFAEHSNKEIVIENIAFDGLIPSLETGKIDMIISSMTITAERAERVDFSDPYANAYLAVLANAESGIESVDDLNSEDMTIAVTTGSTGYLYATNKLPNAQVLALKDAGACIIEVTQGKADGFIRDQLSVYKANQSNPDTTKAVLIPFQDAEPWGAAFHRDNDALREQFNAFLKDFAADGGFDRLTEEYMAEYKAAFDELGFKWFFDWASEAE